MIKSGRKLRSFVQVFLEIYNDRSKRVVSVKLDWFVINFWCYIMLSFIKMLKGLLWTQALKFLNRNELKFGRLQKRQCHEQLGFERRL